MFRLGGGKPKFEPTSKAMQCFIGPCVIKDYKEHQRVFIYLRSCFLLVGALSLVPVPASGCIRGFPDQGFFCTICSLNATENYSYILRGPCVVTHGL